MTRLSYPSFHNFDVWEMALTFWRESELGACVHQISLKLQGLKGEKSTRNAALSLECFSYYSVAVLTPLAVGNTVSLTSQGFVGEAGGRMCDSFLKDDVS